MTVSMLFACEHCGRQLERPFNKNLLDDFIIELLRFERDRLLEFIRRASLDGVFLDAGPSWESEGQRILEEFSESAEPA